MEFTQKKKIKKDRNWWNLYAPAMLDDSLVVYDQMITICQIKINGTTVVILEQCIKNILNIKKSFNRVKFIFQLKIKF